MIRAIKNFNKVIGYMISIHKSIVFLYVGNEYSENKTKKTTPFIIISKNLQVSLTK